MENGYPDEWEEKTSLSGRTKTLKELAEGYLEFYGLGLVR